MGEIVSRIQAAIRSDSFRFDASDSMPTKVSRVFWDGMVRLFREASLAYLDELSADIAADIEAVRLELEGGDR